MENFNLLAWDSAFFGFTVAKILPPRMEDGVLAQVLSEMKKRGVTLAYWASDPGDEESQSAARARNAFLADRKVTFVTDLGADQNPDAGFHESELPVEEYIGNVASAELVDLALQAGVFSRFKTDVRIPEHKFIELYTLWINRSVRKEIADAVFVIRCAGKVAGMVTVGEKGGRSDIGLIAVDASLRGRSAGMSLVEAAQNWGRSKGFVRAQVVTQRDNLPACRFYEKCGYEAEKTENIYHFWID